ncbi:MAG: triose-phosphate isomerase [Gemmatimonadota bacterium]|nr:triose-phosphate isomerase [Gemmatimonadota bacterium]
MRKPVFAANWKMNHGPSDAKEFMRNFLARHVRHSDRTVIIFPPAAALSTVAEAIKGRSDIMVGVQNIFWEDKGAFTGETSAPIARDAGARIALVGHSERRHVFGETNEETAKKCAAAARAGLTPMLCVGEKIDQRERGETSSVCLRQLHAGISLIDPTHVAGMLVAYEPVWAIGSGRTATPDDAAEVHSVLRDALRDVVGAKAADVPILYGGSANPGNAASLLAASNVDGLLVGGASMEPDPWARICGVDLLV